MQRVMYDRLFENEALGVSELEEAVAALSHVPEDLQQLAAALLTQHGFYFAAIKVLFLNAALLHAGLMDMKKVVVATLGERQMCSFPKLHSIRSFAHLRRRDTYACKTHVEGAKRSLPVVLSLRSISCNSM